MDLILAHKHMIVRAEVLKPVTSAADLETWILELISAIKMKIATIPGYKNPVVWDCEIPGNVGMTATAIIETSSITYHDWRTDSGAIIQLDVYSCAPFTVDQVVEQLEKFSPSKIEYKFIDRENTLTLLDSKLH